MKRLLLFLFLYAGFASGQVFRFEPVPVYTSPGGAPSGANVPMYAIPNALFAIYTDNTLVTRATTYTDITASMSCPSGGQITLPGSSVCQSVSGPIGQWGFWAHAPVSGAFFYTVTIGTTLYGPFAISAISGTAPVNTFDIPGNFASTNPDVTTFMGMNANINLNGMSPEALRFELSLINGYRPVSVNGAMIVPQNTSENSVVYEADAVAGMIVGNEPNVNNVALSGFAFPGNDSPNGTASQSGTTLTRLTGPSFDLSWCPPGTQPLTPLYINTIFYVDGVNNFCTAFVDGNHITLQNSATLANVIWAKRKFFWGINTAIADNIVGINGNVPGGYAYNVLSGWENDINVYNTTTEVIGSSYGGGSLVAPVLSIGYLVNTLGPGWMSSGPIAWQYGFESLPGTAQIFASIGPTCMTSNCGSQPITMFSYTSAGHGISGSLVMSADGDMNFEVGSGSMHGENPQFVWEGQNGLILGLSGNVGVDHSTLQGGANTRFQPGHDTLANLTAGGGGAGAAVYCDDCKSVAMNSITAGTVCQGGGSGAYAIFVQAILECF